MQTQTQGLAPWVPLSAAVCEAPTAYAHAQRAWVPGIVTHWSSQALDGGVDLPIETIRRLMDEALAMRKYFYGDFYPLLSFSLAADAWAAWQYDRPDLGEGMVVAFRRHAVPLRHAGRQGCRRWTRRPTTTCGSWDDQSTRRMTGAR